MARTKPKERERERILNDDELRAVWKAAKRFPGPFGYFVRFILLTATRRMRRPICPIQSYLAMNGHFRAR